MNGTTNDKEYIEMKKLLDDDELNKIVERIFPYLRATLFIRNRNIDCTIDLTNSKGYTSHEPRYIYPWGLSNILLNCYEIKSSELEYFIRAFSPYLQIRTVENSYRYISTKGNASTNTAMERWISASENSSFVKLIQQWDSKVPFQIKVPETVTVHEAFGWYLFFSLFEQTKESSAMIEFDKLTSKLTGTNQIPSDFMDFEKRLLQSYETQPTKGERMSLESLKSQVGREGVSSIAINSMNPEIKDLLEKTQLKNLSEIQEKLIKSFSVTSLQKGIDSDFLLRLANRLQEVLSEFDIKCEVNHKNFDIGPRIIRGNVKLGKEVRIQEIRNKSEDIANKLFSDKKLFEFTKDDEVPKNVLIESVPLKGMVGIYLPRNDFKPIGIRKILEAIGGRSNLEFPIGINTIGESQYSDLESMPHLFVSAKEICS